MTNDVNAILEKHGWLPDIVTRLRAKAKLCDHGNPNGGGPMGPDPSSATCRWCPILTEAADTIEQLRAQEATQ